MPSENPETPETTQPIHNISILFKMINCEFSGKRDELNRFIRCCDFAFNMAHASQTDVLLPFIITKITGIASARIEDKEINNWEELKEILIQLFGSKKSYSLIMEELNTLKQNSGESVSSYLSRIEKVQMRALEASNLNRREDQPGQNEAIRLITLHRFIRHSVEDISKCLRWKDPQTLAEAYDIALAEESALRERKRIIHNKSSSQNSFRQVNLNNPSHSSNKFNYNSKICNYCKKPGHLINECRKLKFKNENKNSNHPSNSNRPSNSNFSQKLSSTTQENINLNYLRSQVSAAPVDNL